MAVLLALDGIDGVGKTTQCNLLAKRLKSNGLDVCVLSLHDLSGFDDEINLAPPWNNPEQEVNFFDAQWRRYIGELISPALLAAGDTGVVISDRYLSSFLAYQSIHKNYGIQILFQGLERLAPTPSYTFILDSKPWIPDHRSSDDMFSSLNLETLNSSSRLHHAVRTFRSLGTLAGYRVIDGRRSRQVISDEIWLTLQIENVLKV